MKNHWLQQRKQKKHKLSDHLDFTGAIERNKILKKRLPRLLADTSQLNFILGKIQTVLSDNTADSLQRATALLQKAVVPIYQGKQLIKVNRPFDHLDFLEWCECDDSELHELMFDIDDDEIDDDVLIVGDDEPQGAD